MPTVRQLNHRAVSAVVCLALATVVAAMASLNVALPDIARDTHASQTELACGFTFVILQYLQLVRGDTPPGGGRQRAAASRHDDADRPPGPEARRP